MNRVTLFMCALGALITVLGLGVVWLGIHTNEWPGIIIGMAWAVFAGAGTVYAWRTRYQP